MELCTSALRPSDHGSRDEKMMEIYPIGPSYPMACFIFRCLAQKSLFHSNKTSHSLKLLYLTEALKTDAWKSSVIGVFAVCFQIRTFFRTSRHLFSVCQQQNSSDKPRWAMAIYCIQIV